ncbi:MAG: amidohydrolase family protein [Armatimonadota bacterium]
MSELLQCGRAGRPLPLSDIIDMHGHLGRCSFAIPDTTAAGMVAVMDRLGIRSTVCSHMQSWGAEAIRGNREVLDAMRGFPGRILGYASVWPWPEAEVRAEAAYCLGAGFTGIKVHNSQGFPYTHASYIPMYEMADERHLPMLFHVWGEDRVFGEIAEIARSYPNTNILMAHSGAANVEGYIRMAAEHPNVYLDLAYSASPRGMVERLVSAAGVEKVVFGSDAYFFSQSQQIGKVLGAKITDDAKQQILSGNALRILSQRAE